MDVCAWILHQQMEIRETVMKRRIMKSAMTVAMVVCCTTQAIAEDHLLLETKKVRITSTDFEASLVRIPEENRAEVLASRARIGKLLENLVINKTMASQAREAGIDRDPALKKQMELATDNVLAQAYVNRQIKELELPNFETRAKELYRLDIEKYTIQARVHASHILVETKNRTQEEALKRIQDIRSQALEGKSFETLAQEYSDDPSAANNKGDLGFFEPGRMVKPFSDAAFTLTKPGEISDPVRTVFGYHIIQFHEKQPKQTKQFEDVRPEIIKILSDQYFAEHRQKLVNEILTDPSMILHEEAISRYQTKLDPDQAHLPRQ